MNLEPKVGVIVLNYNQNEYTLDCIYSILKSTYNNYNVFLVDNGSTDSNYKSLEDKLNYDLKINILRLSNNIGYTGGVNHALKQASKLDCDYYLVMSNDTLIDKNAMKELVIESEKNGGSAIVSGKVYNYNNKNSLQYIGQKKNPKDILNHLPYVKNRNEEDIGQYDCKLEMGMLDDIFWMFSSQILNKVGLYSDYFFIYGEQNDFVYRSLNKGFKLAYTHKAKIWHKGGITTSNGNEGSTKIYYWKILATLKLAVLHLPKKKFTYFYLKFVIKNYIKNMLIFFYDFNFDKFKALHEARINFKHWNKVRYSDNGYNPFN